MNCNSSVAMVHLLNAVFGHKNNQIRNRENTEIARLHQVARMQHRNATNTEPICALRQTQANELRITSVYNSLAAAYPAFRCPGAGHDQPMRRSALGARPAPAHGHWRGDRERDGERQRAQPPLHPWRAQGARGGSAYDIPSWEGPHCLGLASAPGAASLPRQFELQEGRDTRRRAATVVWRRTGVLFL